MGIDSTRVKKALKQRIQETGSGFKFANELVESALLQPEGNTINVTRENIQDPTSSVRAATSPALGVHSTQAHFVPGQSQVPTSESQSHSNSVAPNQLSAVNANNVPFGAACNQKLGSDLIQISLLNNRECASAPGMIESNNQMGSTSVEVQPPIIQQVVKDKVEPSVELEIENRRLKDQRTCKICMDREIGVVFLPCGHLISCVQCAPALKDCPLCRQPIHGTVKTYMS